MVELYKFHKSNIPQCLINIATFNICTLNNLYAKWTNFRTNILMLMKQGNHL